MADIYEDLAAGADWIVTALVSSGYRADWTPESLWELDRFFDEQTEDGQARRRGLLADGLGGKLFALGAYAGEVVRRSVGGEWSGDNDDPEAEIHVELRLPDGTVCWPVQRIMKRFRNGSEDGIAVWGAVMGLAVGAEPERVLVAGKKGFWQRILGRD